MQVAVTDLETHRSALTGHCYRMLGSPMDAEDAVQDTMVRAWQNLGRFEGRSSVRTWLYRIATNVCLDALSSRSRRARPIEEGPAGTIEDDLETRPRAHWLEPIPDAEALPADSDPYELTALRQSIRLAFVAALQHLPPRQRAALILTEVLGWSAAEVAECLDTSTAAINSALQRARGTLASRNAASNAAEALRETGSNAAEALRETGSNAGEALRGTGSAGDELSKEESTLVEQYVDAFHRYDVDGLVALLRDDAALSMPPFTLWLQGPDAIRAWLLGRGAGCRGSRLIATRACGSPAFAQYRPDPAGGHTPWSLTVLELAGGRIRHWNAFLDTANLFPRFSLPARL